MYKSISVFVVLSCCGQKYSVYGSQSSYTPTSLRVEHLLEEDALGIDTTEPLLGWVLEPTGIVGSVNRFLVVSDVTVAVSQSISDIAPIQTALRKKSIRNESAKSTESSLLLPHGGNLQVVQVPRDAQRVAVTPIRYTALGASDTLRSSTRYYWTVCVAFVRNVSEASQQSDKSAKERLIQCAPTSVFITGKLNGDAWQASWIGGTTNTTPARCTQCMAPYHAWCKKDEQGLPPCGFVGMQLRSPVFSVAGDVVSAIVHVTGLGMYELYVNAQRVGNGTVLDPGFSTNFTSRLLYSTFDVSHALSSAAARTEVNTTTEIRLAARIGAGKFSLGSTPLPFALLAELHVELSNGKTMVLGTNASWEQASSPIVFENLYIGEVYDARLTTADWHNVTRSGVVKDAVVWHPTSSISSPITGKLSPRLMPPIKIIRTITPLTATKQASVLPNMSTWLFDLGENIPGLARLYLQHMPAGTVVTISYGETLTNGTLNVGFNQVDKYIYAGTEAMGAKWMPTFIYHGFRFIEIANMPPDIDCTVSPCVEGVVMHSAVTATGNIEFAPQNRTAMATTLDAIHQSVLRTQLANLVSHPTDCPHREKRGWMGDASWTAEEAGLNFDVHTLYTNWLQVMMDVQDTGCIRTALEYTQEPPYGTCCSPTTDQIHPTIFQCSPMSNFTDMTGAVPDIVPMLWGAGGSRGFPGENVNIVFSLRRELRRPSTCRPCCCAVWFQPPTIACITRARNNDDVYCPCCRCARVERRHCDHRRRGAGEIRRPRFSRTGVPKPTGIRPVSSTPGEICPRRGPTPIRPVGRLGCSRSSLSR
eukprot:m.181588 g.181588  ORF g.181588 m.181588 type:complete len:817 (+) comp18451_c1_seq21:116-2566(+)